MPEPEPVDTNALATSALAANAVDTNRPWWQTTVCYQIYPRSFLDTTGNGVGDLDGIRRQLDELVDLGIGAIWLSPVFRSPMADYGYDVADFCDVDPLFGDLVALDALIADAHARGLRIILDWVPNHTSIEHPWFVESRSSQDHPKRDWYIWRDPAADGGRPNNWVEALTYGPAWTWDEATGQYYLHNFLPEQPDLNWANPAVVDAMLDTLRFWLDRGVDGFRMDVINLIGKDPELPDEPGDLVGLPHLIMNDRPETHALLRQIRTVLDSYPGDRVSIGEVILMTVPAILSHVGNHDELHLAFNFPPMSGPWTAEAWRTAIEDTERHYRNADAWPTWVLSNHDQPRHRSRYGGSEAVARSAGVLLTMLRGTPFLYAGEELGLSDAVVPADRVLDPGGRDGCRAPIPWDATPTHGWTTADPWLPWPPEATTGGDASSQRGQPDSMRSLYRALLSTRASSNALIAGALQLIDAPDGVVAWTRTSDDERWDIAVNFTDEPVDHALPAGDLVISSDPLRVVADATADDPGVLGPNEAVVVRRR